LSARVTNREEEHHLTPGSRSDVTVTPPCDIHRVRTPVTALERAAVRWQTAAVVPASDLLTDVRNVRCVADVLGPTTTARSMREVAQRALAHDDPEVRKHASRLLAEMDRNPVLRRYSR
jgi:hypothetical protein